MPMTHQLFFWHLHLHQLLLKSPYSWSNHGDDLWLQGCLPGGHMPYQLSGHTFRPYISFLYPTLVRSKIGYNFPRLLKCWPPKITQFPFRLDRREMEWHRSMHKSRTHTHTHRPSPRDLDVTKNWHIISNQVLQLCKITIKFEGVSAKMAKKGLIWHGMTQMHKLCTHDTHTFAYLCFGSYWFP